MADASGFTSKRATTFAVYAAMIAATVVGFLWIGSAGTELVAPPPGKGVVHFGEAAAKAESHTLLHVLVALLVVILASRALGAVFRYVNQPPVIGEVVAGILLGPSLLGRVAPEVSAYILPTTVAPYLSVVAQVGVILYMFLVGLALDTKLLSSKTHTTLAISHASIVAPFLLGAIVALFIYPILSSSDVPFGVFAMFMGVSLSVTAFPVLARILTDRKMHKTKLGVIAISCAAVDDVTAWCLLALMVSVAQARLGGAVFTVGLTLVYIALMFSVARPLVHAFCRKQEIRGEIGSSAIVGAFVAVLSSALIAEFIGVHALFGAFLIGAVIPHESRLAKELLRRLEDVVVILLLPAFFAFTGMRTQIGLVSGLEHWLICGVIIAVACAGKFGGSTLAARLSGLGWRDSACLGVLMNTRGLMELIVLNIGLDLKVISPTLFTMLVIMAVVTTLATSPILARLTRGTSLAEPDLSTARGV
jgi:Kef-type K+ transport system membrane component KefB